MLFAIALSILALGLVCWLLFTLTVYALPVFAGVLAGMFAHQTSAGPVGSVLVGLFAGAMALLLSQVLFAWRDPPCSGR